MTIWLMKSRYTCTWCGIPRACCASAHKSRGIESSASWAFTSPWCLDPYRSCLGGRNCANRSFTFAVFCGSTPNCSDDKRWCLPCETWACSAWPCWCSLIRKHWSSSRYRTTALGWSTADETKIALALTSLSSCMVNCLCSWIVVWW